MKLLIEPQAADVAAFGRQQKVMMTLVTKQHLRVQLKRAYAPPFPEDGVRVLVGRLWPRGLRKSEAAIDRWVKDVAPSTELRRWFGHDPSRWVEFRRKYKAELAHKTELLGALRAIARNNTLTLVFAARDELHNEDIILRDVLTIELERRRRGFVV